jgi:hypothetical protein
MSELTQHKTSGIFFIFDFLFKIYKKVMLRWKLYLFVFLTSFVLIFVYNSIRKSKYISEVTFIVDESKPMSLSAISSVISSQLGADLGGSSGLLMGDNILELLKSRAIAKKVLLEKREKDYINLGNLYLQTSGLEKSIIKKYNLNPTKHFNLIEADKHLQDSLIRVIHERLFKNQITIFRVDKKMSFVKVRCLYTNEEFSKEFVDRLVKEVSDYYIKMKTAKSRMIVERIQNRADSLYAVLKGKTFASAFGQSRSADLNPFFSDVTANIEMNARDKQITLTVYTEVIKNLELAKMNLSQDTPAIQIIDSSEYPLKNDKLGLIAKVFFGTTISLVISFFVFLFLLLTQRLKVIKSSL